MQNLRRILKQPVSLAPDENKASIQSAGMRGMGMADGGMFDGIKRMVGMGPAETITQKYARQDAEQAAKMAKPAPAAQAPAPPPPQSEIAGYVGNAALQRREAAVGLRDGGTPYRYGHMDGGKVVGPGTGISDSVPARYSHGEYVLPADTAKHIGYDKLDEIKDETHTPAAVQRGLRDGGMVYMKNGGYDPLGNLTGGDDEQDQAAVAGVSPDNQRAGVLPGGVRPLAAGGSNGNGQPQPAGAISYGENLRIGLPDTSAVVQGTHDDVSNSLSKGQYAGAVVKGLRGSLAMVPAVLNDTAGAAVRGAYGILKNPFEDTGRAVLGMADRQPSATTPNATPNTAAAAPTATPDGYNTTGADATMPGQDPARGPLLRGQGGTDMGNGVSKFKQNGKTLYSNVTTPGDNDKLMSNNPGVQIMPGGGSGGYAGNNSLRSGASSYGGDDGGALYAARSAALARGDVDAVRASYGAEGFGGKTQGEAQSEAQNNHMQQLAMSRLGTPGRAFAQKQLITNQEQNTLRRAQDITERDNQRTNDTSLRNNKMNNDFNARKFGVEVSQKDREYDASQQAAAFTQHEVSRKALHEEIAGMLPTVDNKPDLETAARYAAGMSADLAAKEGILQREARTGDPKAIAALADYRKNPRSDAYKQKFVTGMQAKEAQAANASGAWNPRGGTGATFNGPVGSMSDDKNGFLGVGRTYSNYDSNGHKVGNTPARIVEKDGSLFGGVDNHTYDSLITQTKK